MKTIKEYENKKIELSKLYLTKSRKYFLSQGA
jgi:hypothetical protein